MGTQVQCKNYLPGYHSMRDLNEDSNSSSWPLFYGDRTLNSGQYYNGYIPRTIADAYPGYDKDQLKQKMLEHEAVFRKQVYELHRLYRIQRDMMEEIKRTELNKRQMSIEASSPSSLLGSQMPSEDAGKWPVSSFPLAHSGYLRPSVSGAEIVNSPLSCTKGITVLAGRVNGCTPKDYEVLEARPLKVRKKLFDLQLPADEYIDTEEGEQLQDSQIIDMTSSLPNGNHKILPEKCDKFSLSGEKITCQRNPSTSNSCQRSTVKLADLNEPVQFEDGAGPSSVDFLGYSANNGESKVVNISARSNSEILGLQKEVTHTAHPVNQSGKPGVVSIGNKSNESNWLAGIYESGEGFYPVAGQRKNNLMSPPQGFQQDKLIVPSQPVQNRVSRTLQPLGILPTDYGREEMWGGRTTHGLENIDRVCSNSNTNYLESVMISQIPAPYSLGNSSDVASSWSHSALSWGKPSSNFSPKISSFHAYPSVQSSSFLSKSSHSSAESRGIFGDKLYNNDSLRFNPGITSDLPPINGFYHGSSSGSKDILGRYPSVGLSNLNCNGSANMASTCYSNYGRVELSKSCVTPAKDMDLNVVQSKCPSDEEASPHDVEVINEKANTEDPLKILPWLRAKPSCKSEVINVREDANSGFFRASSSKSFWGSEPVKDLNKSLTLEKPGSSEWEVGVKEISETQGIKKILGLSIFEKPAGSINESSLPISTSVTPPDSVSGEKVVMEVKNKLIDINLACEEQIASEALAVEKPMDMKAACVRNFIDLNSCITEDEEILVPPVASNKTGLKVVVEIDLEAPVLENEDDILVGEGDKLEEASLQSAEPKVEKTNDEFVRIAAEAIVSLSTSGQLIQMEENICQPSEDPLTECLIWFADAVVAVNKHTNGGKDFRATDKLFVGNCSSDEMDDFEVMTLQLQETKEENCMPKPFVPDAPKMEESGSITAPTRTRKGQTRRGRQRRDFQRDILPGLASLSRHEVTEDLQTFGGLMRATGHQWNPGLTRRNGTRNGGVRGRRRTVVIDTVPIVAATTACTPLIQQLNNIEGGLEDRSLTGWGKTTRRPRRQRCPAAGNPPPAQLT